MKLLTKANEKAIPPLYSQENNSDPLAVVKFFNPTGAGSWYVLEGEKHEDAGGDWLFFGYVTGMNEDELGYFSLPELASSIGRYGLGIERDLWFKPTLLSVIKAKAGQN